MKTMSCKQLGGACEKSFQAETFEEIEELSKKHGMEMFQKGDTAHLKAMEEIRAMMQQPGAIQSWMEERRAAFEALPED
ncbi:MAG: DUF1059 domain-containing protein [Flavobacteriaceae bacterium]|nr:DUF1059 domain-containing protein [Flavobacteriaceae bacterium]